MTLNAQNARLASMRLYEEETSVDVIAARYGLDPSAVVDFSLNVNPLGSPPAAIAAAHAALSTSNLYPELSFGKLRAALASYGLGALLTVCGGGLAALLGGGGDAWVLGGALGGLALAALVNRTLMRSRRWRGGLQMTVAGDAPSCTAGGAHG